jgi:hypothetical protein
VTGPNEEPPPLSVTLAAALGRAALAGLMLERRPNGGLTVRCHGCSIGLALYLWPWLPERTARRVDGFTARHRGHGRPIM